jgi:NADH-quinone oxidoreductase subunit L
LNGEQDLRKMGGLRRKLPITFWVTTIGVLAIAGIPPFAGFFSKDEILFAAFNHGALGQALWFVGLVTALLTSFYMFRLWYLTFMGKPRSEGTHPHESPWSMLGPLVILATLSLVGGFIRIGNFLAPSVGVHAENANASLEWMMSGVAVAVALIGWYIAHRLYSQKPETPETLAAAAPVAYRTLLNKYYVDEIYGAVVVRPLQLISKYFLEWIVEKALLGGLVALTTGLMQFCGAILQKWQSGNIRSYAAWIAAGAAAVLLFLLLTAHQLPAWFCGFHLSNLAR